MKRKKKSKQRPVPDTSAQNPFTKNLIEVAGHGIASLNNQESREADHATFQMFNLLFDLIDLIKNKERNTIYYSDNPVKINKNSNVVRIRGHLNFRASGTPRSFSFMISLMLYNHQVFTKCLQRTFYPERTFTSSPPIGLTDILFWEE